MVINLHQHFTDWKRRLAQGFDTCQARLRLFEESDRAGVHAILTSLNIYTYIKDLENESQGCAWFDHVVDKRNHLFLTMKTKVDKRLAGLMMFHAQPDDSLMLGGIIDESFRNKGYASDFLNGLKARLSSSRFPYPVFADVHEDHSQVRHILETTGWQCSGPSPSANRLIYLLRY